MLVLVYIAFCDPQDEIPIVLYSLSIAADVPLLAFFAARPAVVILLPLLQCLSLEAFSHLLSVLLYCVVVVCQ